ncbi:MAG TPA: class I SAM-dependent methyltransferase [Candidatus Acidoferrales bacterium]|nr:class I SAM-dependent methyltransferase [Candidatus Acidoferrales bacterium]
MRDVESVFRWHFEKRNWTRSRQSVSGLGSTAAATDHLREELPRLLAEFKVRSMLDIPCGDGNWISRANLELDEYIGADIVEELVQLNRKRHETAAGAKFLRLDVIRDELPRVDLIFCRDCLVHFSNEFIGKALKNIRRSGSMYLATTTFPGHDANRDIITGDWRPINLQRAPFHLPAPVRMIAEHSAGPPFEDKSIGVWRIEQLTG